MKVDDIAIVATNKGVRHPIGTKVVVKIIGKPEIDDRPYYCQAYDGKTCYWYGENELKEVKNDAH